MTAQLSAGELEGNPICFKVCCAAPKAGVLVVAPHRIPTMSGREIPQVRWKITVMIVPMNTTPRARALRVIPPFRNNPKKPGPTCRPKAYTKTMSPKLSA